ncbi:MAG: recombination regulator RecX [Schleiferilactobacillus perolens]|uniref:Regulatory protein RecX n=1 Tax=Schleiferilactobacillus perolens DSM 12744 TaxID=1423792 RepID=A0A0R1N8N6_9LACO|nr:recombination regulator RecX [Schleiferilactobacillus perolens]KRL13363.1 recombination regulator RecX [Schleiferilactobacillus perolens DSM 12744]
MATITKISAQKRPGRYNIFLDGEYAFAVDEGVLIQFALAKGDELTPEQVTHIQEQDNFRHAYNIAINYLAHQLRTRHEIWAKLEEKEVAPAYIKQVAAELTKQGYLDDEAYRDSFVRTQILTTANGPRVIERKLREKGISPDLANQDAITDVYPESEQLDTLARLIDKQRSHYRRDSSREQQRKIRQYLYTKGYDGDLVTRAIDDADFTPDPADEAAALAQQAEKYWRRYRSKGSAYQKQKTKQMLYQKGFSFSDIDAWMDENDMENDD